MGKRYWTSFRLKGTLCILGGGLLCGYRHRWGRLLIHQLSITFYSLPPKENKLLFSVSVCRKQTEVCGFRFPLAANIRMLLVSIGSFKKKNIYIYIETAIYIYTENGVIYTYCSFKRKTENKSPGDCPSMVTSYQTGYHFFKICNIDVMEPDPPLPKKVQTQLGQWNRMHAVKLMQ
jgi:hypothetical protein